jgi:hypothetical protein
MISTSTLALALAAGSTTQASELDFSAMSCDSYEQKLHQAGDNPALMKHIDFINLWLSLRLGQEGQRQDFRPGESGLCAEAWRGVPRRTGTSAQRSRGEGARLGHAY